MTTGAPGAEVIVYEAPGGEVRVDVCLERQTVWLTQAQMAERFGRERSVVTEQIRNVFAERELDERSNVQNLHILRRRKKPTRLPACLPCCLPAGRRQTALTQRLRDHEARLAGS